MVKRASSQEKVIKVVIDEKKVVSVMKKFLCSKAADPEELKWFKVVDGVDYFATTLGSAVGIYFQNKYDRRDGTVKYKQPQTKGELLTIDELVYPDVKGMFESNDLNEYTPIVIPVEDIPEFIAVHDSMTKLSTVGGMYNTAEITEASCEKLEIRLYDSPVIFEWTYKIKSEVSRDFWLMGYYYYDFSLMLNIWKSLKELKPDAITLYIKDNESPIFIIGKTVDYLFKFALNRKLTK